jgi:hypothetical protein
MAATGDSVKSKCSFCKNDFSYLPSAKILFLVQEVEFFYWEFASGRRRLPVENWIHFPVSKATGLKRKPSKELNRWEYAKTGAQLF